MTMDKRFNALYDRWIKLAERYGPPYDGKAVTFHDGGENWDWCPPKVPYVGHDININKEIEKLIAAEKNRK